jgi:ArsR family transcriptional regulator
MHRSIKVFKALSDETRLRMINILAERECCVCEVMQTLEISQTRASRNLSMLYDVGFLKLKKEGLWSLYSIDWEGMDLNIKNILRATIKAFAGNKQMALDRERLKDAKRVGVGCVNKECETEPAN